MLRLNKVYNMDCISGMKLLNDHSIDLIIADIPYSVTDNEWDIFETEDDYLLFLDDFFTEVNRIMSFTGNLYIFHSDFPLMAKIQNLIENNTGLEFRNLLVWNKFFEGCENHYLKHVSLCRNNAQGYVRLAEYMLYYSYPIKKDNTSIYNIRDNFINYKKYIQTILDKNKMNWNSKRIINALYYGIGYKSMQSTKGISQRLFSPSFKNFGIMTKKQYEVLNPILNFDKSYEEIYAIYLNDKQDVIIPDKKEARKNTFNNLGKHNSVWNYNPLRLDECIHPTEKPLELITDIILYSSNEGDIVLDPFCGSGVSIVSCIQNNRKYIGFEIDEKYYSDSIERIKKEIINNLENGDYAKKNFQKDHSYR